MYEHQFECEEEIIDVEERNLMVYNDDVNTFDHVIQTLIRVCKHSPEQAEQCTLIVHYKGRCSVKRGSYELLKPMREAICEVGIDVRVI